MSRNNRVSRLLSRLDAIGESLSNCEGALALLGLGSVGKELDRVDRYSDLDFFVIVERGFKHRFIDSLDWLSSVAPVSYSFQNTPDGHKALYHDGIFCEFAVFDLEELSVIPFSEGRVVWRQEGFDDARFVPPAAPPEFGGLSEESLLGELLTNIYVGLCRFARGERLSAYFFVQNYAVQRLLSLIEIWDDPIVPSKDSFANERRFEERFPDYSLLIESVTPGYRYTPEAASRMVEFLSEKTELNADLVREINRLIDSIRLDRDALSQPSRAPAT